MHLQFYGAAGEVTGSCHILTVGSCKLLLDCGLIQGGDQPDIRNRQPFPFDAAAIDAVVLSHAHIDHCGRLPLLRKRGFRGPIYATPACRDLARILLADSAFMAEREAERYRRRQAEHGNRHARGFPDPLFTRVDADETIQQFKPVAYGHATEVLPGVTLTFRDASSRDVYTALARFANINIVFDPQCRDQPVTIEEGRGIIRATGLILDNASRTLKLKSEVRGTMQPGNLAR